MNLSIQRWKWQLWDYESAIVNCITCYGEMWLAEKVFIWYLYGYKLMTYGHLHVTDWTVMVFHQTCHSSTYQYRRAGEISDLHAIEGVYLLKETKSCKMSGLIKMTWQHKGCITWHCWRNIVVFVSRWTFYSSSRDSLQPNWIRHSTHKVIYCVWRHVCCTCWGKYLLCWVFS